MQCTPLIHLVTSVQFIPVDYYKTVHFAWLEEDTCYEFSAAVCPIEGQPLGRGGYDPGGTEGIFHCSMLQGDPRTLLLLKHT